MSWLRLRVLKKIILMGNTISNASDPQYLLDKTWGLWFYSSDPSQGNNLTLRSKLITPLPVISSSINPTLLPHTILQNQSPPVPQILSHARDPSPHSSNSEECCIPYRQDLYMAAPTHWNTFHLSFQFSTARIGPLSVHNSQ